MAVHPLQQEEKAPQKAVRPLMRHGRIPRSGSIQDLVIQDDGPRIDITFCDITAFILHDQGRSKAEKVFPKRSVFGKDADQQLLSHRPDPFLRVDWFIFSDLILITVLMNDISNPGIVFRGHHRDQIFVHRKGTGISGLQAVRLIQNDACKMALHMAGPEIKAIAQTQCRCNGIAVLHKREAAPDFFKFDPRLNKDVHLKVFNPLLKYRFRADDLQFIDPGTGHVPVAARRLELLRMFSDMCFQVIGKFPVEYFPDHIDDRIRCKCFVYSCSVQFLPFLLRHVLLGHKRVRALRDCSLSQCYQLLPILPVFP